jgi:hypothetical protein
MFSISSQIFNIFLRLGNVQGERPARLKIASPASKCKRQASLPAAAGNDLKRSVTFNLHLRRGVVNIIKRATCLHNYVIRRVSLPKSPPNTTIAPQTIKSVQLITNPTAAWLYPQSLKNFAM